MEVQTVTVFRDGFGDDAAAFSDSFYATNMTAEDIIAVHRHYGELQAFRCTYRGREVWNVNTGFSICTKLNFGVALQMMNQKNDEPIYTDELQGHYVIVMYYGD